MTRDFTEYELRLRSVLQEAIRAWPQFDTESEEVSGADVSGQSSPAPMEG